MRKWINSQSEKEFTVVGISPSELFSNNARITWEDDNKEVILNGNLYDVVGIRTGGAKVLLTLMCDQKEKEMKAMYASLYRENDGTDSSPLLKLMKQLLQLKYLGEEHASAAPLSSSAMDLSCMVSALQEGIHDTVFLPPNS